MKTIVLFLLFCLLFFSGNAYTRLQFRNIAFKEGLNNMNVSAVAQDQLGYIWVATMGGVSRYNGNDFKRFYFNPRDSNSLKSNHVSSIFCASDGIVYIGTAVGLNYYDVRQDKILSPFRDGRKYDVKDICESGGYIYLGTNQGLFRFKSGSDKLEVLGNNLTKSLSINCLMFGRDGALWCGLSDGMGLAVYDLNTDRFDLFLNTSKSAGDNQNTVKAIFQVSENILLLGTADGISSYDLNTKQFSECGEFSQLCLGVLGCDIRFILEKEPSIYWVGTLHNGLFIYDRVRNTLTRHFQDDGFSEIHSNNFISYCVDRSGNVWIGTFDAGLEVNFKQAKNFNYDVFLNKITEDRFITSISEDRLGNLIITTRENGLIIYDPEEKKSTVLNTSNSRLKHSNVRTLFVDSKNKYWIGVYYGLQLYDPSRKAFKTLALPEPNKGAVSVMQIKDRIYVGTDGQGLCVFDLQGNFLKQILSSGINIPSIISLNEKEIIFTSYSTGLFVMNLDDYSVRRFALADLRNYPGLAFAFTIFKDKEGKIWVGTYDYGLFCLDLGKHEVTNLNVDDDMPSSDAVGIAEDENSNLWISTSYGLVKLEKVDHKIKTYFLNEGVNNYQFHGKAAFKDKKGNIYFGGNWGLTYFKPSEIIQDVSDAPNVVLENLYIKNIQVTPASENSVLKESLPFAGEITLNHKDQLFSIDFVSFDYLSPEKIRYYYMLEGFDRDWYDIGNQRRVSYSNLPRGKYVFKVKSVNHAGIHSENEAELRVKVRPAPWFSYTAWFIYLLIVAGITYFIFSLRIKAFLYKKNLEIEHSEHAREREINVMKHKFFTNISHELRTPLTLIYGLVTQLSAQEKLSPKVREYAQTLDLNVGRLLKLVNQLLAFKKLEGETLSLWLEKGNINDALQNILKLFRLYSGEKEILIELQEGNSYEVWFDYDKLEKILSNLLSNAIKHSQPGGLIEVSITKITGTQARQKYSFRKEEQEQEYLEISVCDNGSGIDEKDWETIFDRYKQVEIDGKLLPDYSGTGIGLNFTKSLVELHKGKIRLESKLGQGSTFSFILPFNNEGYNEQDFAVSQHQSEEEVLEHVIDEIEILTEHPNTVSSDFEKTLLIVEDDPQLNNFLTGVLKDYYKIISAHDGEKGLELVRKVHPDIVISDVMMPKKNGYELTEAIKESREICHIPVILLTAKTDMSSQIEGMNCGADLYIPKPFNVEFLLSAINTQLKNRERIHEIFLNGQMPSLERSEINQLDMQFLSKLNALLEKELSNSSLDIQMIAQNLNLSRSVFYRKFTSLTKLSPIAYIKKYRINKAVEFIKTGKYSLGEIGEMTGFGSPSYFSTAFKQEKGVSPREFVSQIKDADAEN